MTVVLVLDLTVTMPAALAVVLVLDPIVTMLAALAVVLVIDPAVTMLVDAELRSLFRSDLHNRGIRIHMNTPGVTFE